MEVVQIVKQIKGTNNKHALIGSLYFFMSDMTNFVFVIESAIMSEPINTCSDSNAPKWSQIVIRYF